jgi:HEAT repeat protein
LLAILEAGPTSLIAPRVIEVLPHFGRPDSIALLESILLRGVELVSEPAGQALGRIDHPAAAEALRKGLRSTSPLVINAAADGWMLKDSKAPCLDLTALVTHPDPNVRYHAIRAAAKLGCLGANDFKRLESEDTDPDVRALARQLLLNRR